MKKILVFSSHTGGGHMSLSEAIRDIVYAKYEVDIIDPQLHIFNFHYRMVSRYAPWIWNTEYKLFDGNKRARVVHEIAKPTLVIPIQRTIRRVNPDLIISTYPLVTSAIKYAMELIQFQCPFAMLFSDPNGVHHAWLTEKRADAVFAPTRETYKQALMSGFDPKRTHYTGWPVRKQFYHMDSSTNIPELTDLNLDKKKFTIFLQGGAEGAARFTGIVENLSKIDNIQIILATGTNRNLYRYFKNISNIYPLAFTNEIAKYMAVADVVMGKAGPNMLFEAITLGKPFIATAYIPGQEELNLEFINRHGLGWIALDKRKQTCLIKALIDSPDKINEKLISVEMYRKQNIKATEAIPILIDQLIK